MFKSKYLKYLVTFVLITIFVLSSFSVSSTALSSFNYSLIDFKWLNQPGYEPFHEWEERTVNGKNYTHLGWNTYSLEKITSVYQLSNDLKVGNNYTISFDIINHCHSRDEAASISKDAYMTMYMALSTSLTDYSNSIEICSFDTLDNISEYNIQFSYPNQFSGKQVYLICVFFGFPAKDADNNPVRSAMIVDVSDFVFTDNNSSEYEKTDNILDWLNRIYHSIAGGTDSSGISHIGIVQAIQDLGTCLNSKLTSCTSDLTSKLDSCKSALISHLTNCTNTLWSNLQSALNTINSNLLLFKHSVENSFSDFLSFFDSKFTVLFEKLDTLIKGKSVSEDDFDTSGKDNIDNINKDIEDTESNLPDFNGSDFDKVINTDILSNLSKGFIALNSVFSIVVDKLGFTSIIVFFLSFGLAIYIIGRRLG